MKLRSSLGLFLVLIMLFSMMSNVVMAETMQITSEEQETPDIYEIISSGIGTSTSYLQEQLTELHEDGGISYGFEWYMISMLRAGKAIDEDILDEYYESVATEVSNWDSDVKPTDVEKTALALVLMDKDTTNIGGVNLAEFIYNSDRLSEGANELAYALIALDAANLEIPDTALWNREKIVEELLKFQANDGGFGLNDNTTSDVDMTAICLQALAPYKETETVNKAIDKAFIYLKDSVSDDYNYSDNVNSTAQVLLAVATFKIDVTDSDNGFGDETDNIIIALEAYRNTEGNGYLYENHINAMATVQVMQAYDAYRKADKEGITYWDFATEGASYEDEINGDNSDVGDDSETETAEPVNIYVTIASNGTIVKDKDDGYMAQALVTVTDRDKDGILTVDEALYATHESYYQGGAEAGYNTFEGEYGLSLGMLWGEGTPGVTASAGYWLNNTSCWSLEDTVKEGDYLTAFNYYDALGYSDEYSYFEENEVSVEQGSSVKLTLNAVGYDSNWNTVVEPYSGAKVILLESDNSEPYTTDDNGQVEISISDSVTTASYYVMAYKEDGSIVPAVCKINVIEESDSGDNSDDEEDIEVAEPINIYVTIASDGTIVRDKDNGYVAQALVTVTDRDKDGILTVDEALYATHESYYQGGAEAGYNTFEGEYGLSLGMLWGEGTPGVTASAGYWLNNTSCWSLEDTVKEGDYLTAFNYYDALGYSDEYSYFEENEVSVEQGSSVKLTLNAVGYDSNWNTIVEPYSGAKVIFLESNNSAQKTFTTNNKGQVRINFSNSSYTGSYYVIAYKEDRTIVPAVCKINVIEKTGSSDVSTLKNISVNIRVGDPKGTTFLKKTSYSVEKGTSVYDLLQETGLDIEVTRSAYGVYVKAIEGLAEFDEGNESGWMYRVNGKFPNYSASLYILSKGDYIEWLYTRNCGDDIGETSFASSSSSSKPKDEKPKEEQEDVKQEEQKEEQQQQEQNEENIPFAETTFADVKQEDWHYKSVKYAYEKNLMKGTGNGFEPNSNMTRAMLVTVLFNLENPEQTTFVHNFVDVPNDEWYNNPVAWAFENNIVAGIGDNEFAPEENISREQMMTIIYRYAKMKGYMVDSKADLSQYNDADIISDWAMEAVQWSNAVELVRGTSDTTLSPLDGATRAEVATILMNLCENVMD